MVPFHLHSQRPSQSGIHYRSAIKDLVSSTYYMGYSWRRRERDSHVIVCSYYINRLASRLRDINKFPPPGFFREQFCLCSTTSCLRTDTTRRNGASNHCCNVQLKSVGVGFCLQLILLGCCWVWRVDSTLPETSSAFLRVFVKVSSRGLNSECKFLTLWILEVFLG